jgi:dTDP-4-dehydrorhamnose 3,5-epimerase
MLYRIIQNKKTSRNHVFSNSPTPILSVFLLERHKHVDSRGYFERIFCLDILQSLGWGKITAQINHSSTRLAGTVRGLHYQLPPHAEHKLVSCLRGEVWDVVLDLRHNSTTYLRWYAVHLTPENGRTLLIPPGCAHGFQTLSADVEMLYCHSVPYVPDSEAGILAQDPRLHIPWPLPISQISDKDVSYPLLSPEFQGVLL